MHFGWRLPVRPVLYVPLMSLRDAGLAGCICVLSIRTGILHKGIGSLRKGRHYRVRGGVRSCRSLSFEVCCVVFPFLESQKAVAVRRRVCGVDVHGGLLGMYMDK